MTKKVEDNEKGSRKLFCCKNVKDQVEVYLLF